MAWPLSGMRGQPRSTKFSLSDGHSGLLVKCVAGCTFTDIVRELRSRGLLTDATHEQREYAAQKRYLRDQVEASLMLFVYRQNIARGYQLNEAETARYLDLKRRALGD